MRRVLGTSINAMYFCLERENHKPIPYLVHYKGLHNVIRIDMPKPFFDHAPYLNLSKTVISLK